MNRSQLIVLQSPIDIKFFMQVADFQMMRPSPDLGHPCCDCK